MKRTFLTSFLTACSVLFSAGVHAQARENNQGNDAYDAGKYELALDKFQKARSRAEKAGDVQYRAMAIYGMARASAQLCKTTEAEVLFRESISIRESVPDDSKAYLTQNWIEFGRFLVANNRPAEAVPYFAKAVPRLEALGIESSDPIAYAQFLDTYVDALKASGADASAEELVLKASVLREKNPGKYAHFTPSVYWPGCGH
jgi:tetratricopeptide (TPR) repeat protein